jgi:hypothetical protein
MVLFDGGPDAEDPVEAAGPAQEWSGPDQVRAPSAFTYALSWRRSSMSSSRAPPLSTFVGKVQHMVGLVAGQVHHQQLQALVALLGQA